MTSAMPLPVTLLRGQIAKKKSSTTFPAHLSTYLTYSENCFVPLTSAVWSAKIEKHFAALTWATNSAKIKALHTEIISFWICWLMHVVFNALFRKWCIFKSVSPPTALSSVPQQCSKASIVMQLPLFVRIRLTTVILPYTTPSFDDHIISRSKQWEASVYDCQLFLSCVAYQYEDRQSPETCAQHSLNFCRTEHMFCDNPRFHGSWSPSWP